MLLKTLFRCVDIIDTAAMYENEHEIGLAIKELLPIHNLTRKDVFITTKLCKLLL